MVTLLLLLCSWWLFQRINSPAYFLSPLVEAVATLCIAVYFFICFPLLPLLLLPLSLPLKKIKHWKHISAAHHCPLSTVTGGHCGWSQSQDLAELATFIQYCSFPVLACCLLQVSPCPFFISPWLQMWPSFIFSLNLPPYHFHLSVPSSRHFSIG